MDLKRAAFSGPDIIEGKVPANCAYIGYLEVLENSADTGNRLVQLELWPLRKLGTFVFQKDTSFAEEGTGEISQATAEAVISALNQACNDYYYDAEVGVMDVDFDNPVTTGIYGECVNYNGYLHGTGTIVPADGGVFQAGTSQIEFYMDLSAEPICVYYPENTTLGQKIISITRWGKLCEASREGDF